MKRNLKRILTVLFAVAFVFCIVPAKAQAAAETTVSINYVDSSWTYQFWGDPVDTGVVAETATVTGPGEYSTSLDFTGTADGKANGLTFAALITAKGGDTTFPGYFMEINSIKINGEDIDFGKHYTCVDDGSDQIRVNIYNGWETDVKGGARRVDGDLTDASWLIVDPAVFVDVETISVDFTVYDADGNDGSATVTDDAATVTEDTAATTEDTVATTEDTATTDVPKTGVVGLGLVYGLGVIATGAAVLKKKER